jgi:hypothetical protein
MNQRIKHLDEFINENLNVNVNVNDKFESHIWELISKFKKQMSYREMGQILSNLSLMLQK